MNERNQALEPLMFIEQPTERIPQSSMQQTYSSLHDQLPTYDQQTNVEKTSNTKNKKRRGFNRNYMNTLDIVEEIQSVEEPVNTEELNEKEEEQTFSDLTLEEKVIYCTSTSSYIPKIMCVIKTEKQTVVGIIGKYEEGIVHIKPQKSRVFTEIPLEEIISIRMIGF